MTNSHPMEISYDGRMGGGITYGCALANLAWHILTDARLNIEAGRLDNQSTFQQMLTKVPHLEEALANTALKDHWQRAVNFGESLEMIRESMTENLTAGEMELLKQAALDAVENGVQRKQSQPPRPMQPLFWYPNTDTLHQQVTQLLLDQRHPDRKQQSSIDEAVVAAQHAVPGLDRMVHEYPGGTVEITQPAHSIVMQLVDDLAQEIIERIPTDQIEDFYRECPSPAPLGEDETPNDGTANDPGAADREKTSPAPDINHLAHPDYVLTGTTTSDIGMYYASINESTVYGENLTEWEKLPDEEKARLVEICQTALEQNPNIDLIDVLSENIDWDKWAKDEDDEEDDEDEG